jgi:hypothetical protein
MLYTDSPMNHTPIKELTDLLNSVSTDQQQELATSCGTSVGQLRNVGYGYRPCGHLLAVRLEKQSGRLFGINRKVYRWTLCPNDWHLMWPELVGRKGSPEPATTEQGA